MGCRKNTSSLAPAQTARTRVLLDSSAGHCHCLTFFFKPGMEVLKTTHHRCSLCAAWRRCSAEDRSHLSPLCHRSDSRGLEGDAKTEVRLLPAVHILMTECYSNSRLFLGKGNKQLHSFSINISPVLLFIQPWQAQRAASKQQRRSGSNDLYSGHWHTWELLSIVRKALCPGHPWLPKRRTIKERRQE